jgi:hypothetical protein
MADFSLEYCRKFNVDALYDFSIEAEFNNLLAGSYKPLTCSGYGFSGIIKTDGGECFLVFDMRKFNGEGYKLVHYSDLDNFNGHQLIDF